MLIETFSNQHKKKILINKK